jgi:predicted nuclease of predicted toxin-antitoxin system
MIFLADESVDVPIIKALRSNNFDVRSIFEESPAVDDEVVLQQANDDKRILLTIDKDFGELVFRLRLVHCGVILIRLEGSSTSEKCEIVLRAIQNYGSELTEAFTVIQSGLVRIRKRLS